MSLGNVLIHEEAKAIFGIQIKFLNCKVRKTHNKTSLFFKGSVHSLLIGVIVSHYAREGF